MPFGQLALTRLDVGLATPLGCFGIVDYLAGSSATVKSALVSLSQHFSDIARDTRLILSESPGGLWFEVRAQEGPMREEITLAVTIGRFRRLVAGGVAPERVSLRSAPAGETRYAELYGCPVELGAPRTAMQIRTEDAARPLSTADPQLAATLAAAAARLGLGADDTPELELAVRSRLRDQLEHGRADAASVARAIGVSERTLHRRLAGIGKSFQGVLDAFRQHESIRLLDAGRGHAEIALALGYADQSAWSRAFKRWTGKSPRIYASVSLAGPTGQRRPAPRSP